MLPANTGPLLVSSVIVALLSVWATVAHIEPKEASITLEPHEASVTVGKIFKVQVVVESKVPTNAFSGLIHFDPNIFEVTTIDYNTSIADLWVTEPWYENGAGTINFTGGTTKPGGFTGNNTLMTISFTSLTSSSSAIKIIRSQVLAHDGLGSTVPLKPAIDALFSSETVAKQAKVLGKGTGYSEIRVIEITKPPSPDLNNDEKINTLDISIFMTKLFSNNPRYDFNQDGEVSLADLSILMDARK